MTAGPTIQFSTRPTLLRRLRIWLRRHERGLREIGFGLVLYGGFNLAFDWIFYPVVIATLGVGPGGLLCTALALAVNALVFWLYDEMGVDWLGANALRKLDSKETGALGRLATWLGRPKTSLWEKLASPAVFMALTLPVDPVVVAVHHQRRHFQGLRVADWGLLAAATIAANVWWTVKVGFVVELVKFALGQVL